jgi:G6PDH family F420-dependent oxidoreductase
VEIAYALSSEDHAPRDLVRFARMAEEAGLRSVWVSDHYHPWNDEQGHAPFVWSIVGAITAATDLRVGTGVTCPTVRIHPAIIAQAAATSAVLAEGRFFLGVGSGEALNEHILGDAWPEADIRLEMLEEAVEVMRLLWQGGQQSHRGRHYTVSNARLYDLPDEPPPVYVSAFGPKALELAARIGDGYVGTGPEEELVSSFRKMANRDDAPALAGAKVCWAPDEAEARRMVHRLWPNMGLPGELSQVLPTPAHFEQATELVTEEMVAGSIPTGPDPEPYIASLREYADAGYTEVYVHNIGPHQQEFLHLLTTEVVPAL